MLELNTFSIAARCARTGQLGVAVATAVPGVGGLCPFVASGVGAIATQSWVNPYLGIDGLELLRAGRSAEAALAELMAGDPGRELRQVGIVDAAGRSAAWSGAECTGWFGQRSGPDFAIQGNMLVGAATLDAMVASFAGTAALSLGDRLLAALEAGQEAGGDKRGRQSAALLVHHREAYPCLSLRVDEHRQPVAELRRVYEVARHQLLPFVAGLPSREAPRGALPPEVSAMLALAPSDRPGGGSGA
jgi:uncharacterized Ntn-hydrolase superfamily protein